MNGLVAPPEIVVWACNWVRARLRERPEPVCQDVVVDFMEPPVDSSEFPEKLVVIGYSGATDQDVGLFDVSLRVSTLAGSREYPWECIELARIVHAIVADAARVEDGNPVSQVFAARGPMPVEEAHPRARRLSLFEMQTVGDELP